MNAARHRDGCARSRGAHGLQVEGDLAPATAERVAEPLELAESVIGESRNPWRCFTEPASRLLASLVLEGPLVFVLVLGAWITAARRGWVPETSELVAQQPRQASAAVQQPAVDAPPAVGPGDLAVLRAKRLTVPVEGISRAELLDHFDDPRGERRHEAIDIMAPRGTPVRAVEDGVIARLFESRLGGLSIYQFDPGARFSYYYAHLERYAPSLSESETVRRGQVIGYVGTSGNAPDEAPHLHFAIYRLGPEQRWWEGVPLNPYSALKEE